MVILIKNLVEDLNDLIIVFNDGSKVEKIFIQCSMKLQCDLMKERSLFF